MRGSIGSGNGEDAIVSVMTEVMNARKERGSFVHTNMTEALSTLGEIVEIELDLIRHRILFERV